MPRLLSKVDVFRAIADPTRRAILDRLGEGEQPVSQLAQPFAITQPALSQHLRVLREAGLVRQRPDGRRRLYRLNAAPLKAVANWIDHYHRFWHERLEALDEHLRRNP